jgi:hypothetical protein
MVPELVGDDISQGEIARRSQLGLHLVEEPGPSSRRIELVIEDVNGSWIQPCPNGLSRPRRAIGNPPKGSPPPSTPTSGRRGRCDCRGQSRIISISSSVALAGWSFEHQFCLTPSSGRINRGTVGCQVELKIAQGEPGTRGQGHKRRKSDRPLFPRAREV